MTGRENILIVDDKPDNLRLLSNILIAEGYKVRKALNGRLAIDAAQLEPPDLILLDIMMPEVDGYQICQDLKANPQTQKISVIFLSALDNVADKVKAFTVGGVDYITKPFQQEEVLARVKTHLQVRKLNQSLQAQNTLLEQEIQHRQQVEAELTKTLQELQDTQAQIIVKEKLASLGALMGGIAHELRNPLNFVNNYAEGSMELIEEMATELKAQASHLEAEALDSLQELVQEVRENATSIHQHGQRAERIIENMMQHVRAEPGEQQLIHLPHLLEEAIALAYYSRRSITDGLNVKIETRHDPSMMSFKGVPSDLSRALINLIDNALYAVHKRQQQTGSAFQPTILVTTQKLDNQIELKIRDNGIGIAPELQSKIFDPFFTTKANQGTGLGLSITYDIIVGQHHGALSVTSEPDSYTEFTVILPV
jgi:two-component system, NtrC family, sensor kinase